VDGADVSRAAPETCAAHAHAATAGVKASTTGVKASTTSMKAAAATGVEAAATAVTTAATAAVSATTAVAGRRCAGANDDHGRPGQKREGKLAFHVTTPSSRVPHLAPARRHLSETETAAR
jgi:hypothetical protein